MRRGTTAVLSIIFLLTAAITLGSWTAAGAATNLTYSIFFPPTHGQAKAAEAWAQGDRKEERNGKVKITVLPGGTLTPADQCYDGVVKGISDIGMSCFAYTRGRFPADGGPRSSDGYPNGRVATRVANDFYQTCMPKELER